LAVGQSYTETYKYNTIDEVPHIDQPVPGSRINSHRPIFKCGGLNVENCEFRVTNKNGRIDYGFQPVDATLSTVDIPLDGGTVKVHWTYLHNGEPKAEDLYYKTIECGDSKVGEGEQCDWGDLNGIECTPEPNSSCEYCSNQCSLVTKSNTIVIRFPTGR